MMACSFAEAVEVYGLWSGGVYVARIRSEAVVGGMVRMSGGFTIVK